MSLAQRDRCRVILATSQATLDQADVRLTTMDEEIRTARERSQSRPGLLDISALRATEEYLSLLRAERTRLAEQHAAATAQVAADREQLVAADREVRTLEKLRDQRVATFRAGELRREQREIEEVAASGAQHRLEP